MNPLLLLLCLSEYIIYPNKAPVETNFVVIVQWLSRVRLFATPWTAALQASLSFTISWSLLKLKSIKSVMFIILEILCTLTEDNKEFVML